MAVPIRRSIRVVRFGTFEVDLRAGELRRQGLNIRLQEQPLLILQLLLERPGEVVTRDELQKELWGADTHVEFEHGLNAAIKRLRHSLDDSAVNPRFIETLPRRGYRFIAPVEVAGVDPLPHGTGPTLSREAPADTSATPRPKFYIYISDAKLDMLFPQVPYEVKKKVATELGIDINVLTGKRNTETETERDRIMRLEAVVAFLQESGNIGSIDEPGEYIQDTLTMHWGELNGPLIYFVGTTKKTQLCLGGSSRYVLGNIEVERHYSNSLRLMANLLNGLDSKQLDPSAATDLALRTIEEATSELWLTVQERRLEFLAKRLLYGRSPSSHEKWCFLASPLYVALAK